MIAIAKQAENDMRAAGLGYHFPLLFGDDTKKIWTLRKAGLGLLGNLPGDDKAVPVIEDTAVDVNDLPELLKIGHHEIGEYPSHEHFRKVQGSRKRAALPNWGKYGRDIHEADNRQQVVPFPR